MDRDAKIGNSKKRCQWVNLNNPIYINYHDTEWGIPVHNDHKLFEMLILEGFQAGLSWECILNKRKAFEEAFNDFDIEKICSYGEKELGELLNNTGIIRNKLKIRASKTNAIIFKEIQQEYDSFSNYLWHWTNGKVVYENNKISSKLSDKISKDLQKRGMKFVGKVIIYSYLQAVGVINSHEKGCYLQHK